MGWRLARSLEALRNQINSTFPGRSKLSDGTIGDAAHAARASYHNPDSHGIVRALDVTHDPAHGVDIAKFTAQLAASGDPRVLELICNGRYWSKSRPTWVPYTGANKHDKHFHISAIAPASGGDDIRRWNIPMLGAPTATGSATTELSSVLRRGSTGAKVTQLQRVLAAWYPTLRLVVDGVFGPGTEAAVRHFQSRARLVVDGIAGPATLRKLGLAL